MDAPNKQAVIDLHQKAHGAIPQRIIEVNETIVESFLGRIEDPVKSQKTSLNIVNNPSFRILVVLKLEKDKVQNSVALLSKSALEEISITLAVNDGRIVRQSEDALLIVFDTTTNALKATIAIKKLLSQIKETSFQSHIGVCAGLPVTEAHGLFEETIKNAEYLCAISQSHILITSEIRDLYEGENQNRPINEDLIQVISVSDEQFLNEMMNYLEKEWRNPNLGIPDFCSNLGLSTSQLYRKMTAILKKSTNGLLQDFRLAKALHLLRKKDRNISEIAFETGFNSAAYFTKCFQKKYGISPSTFVKNLATRTT
jgi:AraC-like DNA-binding protein